MDVSATYRPKVLIWNIHGAYLYYLSLGDYIIYVPYDSEYSDRYTGRGNTYPYGNNVIEVPASEIKNIDFDIILYQCDENYFVDQLNILSEQQKKLPKIYLEHDPPWDHPTDARHPITDPSVTLVHVTHYNRLMWHTMVSDIRTISHGVETGDTLYKGTLKKGVVVINNLSRRGRMLGYDIFRRVKKEVPLDLVGIGAEEIGLGEIKHPDLMEAISHYCFFFSPIRYTSLGLSTCEAMMIGMPVVGLSTTELPTIIHNEKTGFIHNDISYLVDKMKLLLAVPSVAYDISYAAREQAKNLFNIQRFTKEWKSLFFEKIIKHNSHEKKTNSVY